MECDLAEVHMKSTWNKTASAAVSAVKAAVKRVVETATAHRCDPTGFSCDCARKAEINARSSGSGWIEKRKGWLRGRR